MRMTLFAAAVALTALAGPQGAVAQTELDHRVQRAWDDVFNPPPPGDPRTNWERRRDNGRYQDQRRGAAYQQREADQHAEWCRYNPRGEGCGRYYNR